jgi:hypothetical protein
MIHFHLIILLTCLIAADSSPIYEQLPPVIIDDHAINTNPNTHTTIFNPIGKYATDVHYQLIRIPIHFKPIKDAQEDLSIFMHNVKNVVRGKATEFPINQVIHLANSTLSMIRQRTINMQLNLPTSSITPHAGEKKRFLDLIFGIAGTAFGISNQIQITRINSIIAKEIHRTDMLVDISQLHENHLHSLDLQISNTAKTISDFVQYSPAVASQALTGMLMHVNNVQTKVEDALEQAQLHRLSHKIFPNSVLETIKANIDLTAEKHGYISFVKQTTDLFQIPLSYVYQPNNETVALILHVPFVKSEYLLTLNQYLPFPLSHNLSPNHSLTPAVGQYDILAYSGYETFKLVSQSDLAACHKMGETYFCKGRNDLRTDMQETCMGSLFLQQGKGVQRNCKFEINPAREQVFKLAYNKWTIATQKQYTTYQVCGKNRRPMIISPGAIITLDPGCKVRLQTHILTADTLEEIEMTPTYFTWNWNASQIFPDLAPSQFSEAMQSLRDYGLHIVDAADIAHHLKFANFNDPTPKNISELFANPLHYLSIIVVFIVIVISTYLIYQNCKPRIHEQLKATLPASVAAYIPNIPVAPPAYIHNDPNGLPMVSLQY